MEDDEGSPALLQKRWVKDAAREQQQQRRRRQVEEAEKSGSKASGTTGARCQGQGEEEGKEGPAQHEKDRVEAEEDEHRARLVSGVRAALQQRLAAEAQEKARAAAAASMVGRLLRESERVLAALAYREVLPLSLAAPSSSGHGFARGLVLLVPARRTAAAAAAEEEDGGGGGSGPAHDDEPVAAPLPRPVFPIARFALRRRKGRGGAVVGLEARMQAADGCVLSSCMVGGVSQD